MSIQPFRPNRPGSSPFDSIRHTDTDPQRGEFEWWEARELMPHLGYSTWEGFADVIDRATAACRESGFEPADHFRRASKMVTLGSGAVRRVIDVHMSRRGCYLTAMSGDSRKPAIAAALNYFAEQTRRAELAAADPVAPSTPAVEPWAARFRRTLGPHVRDLFNSHPGCFSVVSALSAEILTIEDEMVRHQMATRSFDRPDISIGRTWAVYRREYGLADSEVLAPLYLPDQKLTVEVRVYGETEWGNFSRWFRGVYLTDKLHPYLANKRELKIHGPLPVASAADRACRELTGRPTNLPAARRAELAATGGGQVLAKRLVTAPPRRLPPPA